ncbi:MGMT family protein [Glutamicibacter sp.]|uniref:MGMT family protein n=1 Tax=Glutamicibacter sp. TaxID=1931995 RepID=UPI003D6BD444
MTSDAAEKPLDYSGAVHRLAALVPAGAVLSYKDVAELLGSGGARQAGKAMASAPDGTPWWRIIRSNGSMADALAETAERHWIAEELAAPGRHVNMNRYRWNPSDLAWEKIDALRTALGNPKMSEIDDQL